MTNQYQEVFSNNSSINSEFYELLEHFDPKSQGRMKKAFRSAKKALDSHLDENTDANARHIFREFLPAAKLNQYGFSFEYEKLLYGKRPDWTDVSKRIILESYTFERNGNSKFEDRVITVIQEKYNKYLSILEENSYSFILSIYLDFFTCVTIDECQENEQKFLPLFLNNSQLLSIVFFTESSRINQKQNYDYFGFLSDKAMNPITKWPFPVKNILS